MKLYRTITKQISNYKSNNQFIDIYTYGYIESKSDFNTGISNVSTERIRKDTGIAEKTLSSVIGRLEKHNELITIERKASQEHVLKGEYFIKNNSYQFNIKPVNFYFLDNSFFELDIPNKIKGFLMQLKSVCKNNTNKYISKKPIQNGINKTELSKLLNTDVKTLNSILLECVTFKQIRFIDNGILILNKCFLLNVQETRENEIYNTIYNYCIELGNIPPERKENVIREIKFKYLHSNNELETYSNYTTDKAEFLKSNSIIDILQERCKNLPDHSTLEYFKKVLGIGKVEIKAPITFIM